tara:strand:+ start:12775 stop:13365 length:591 start_codon:yes stop_codon:yes gene_type:complete
MKKLIKSLLITTPIIMASGCATLIDGSTETLTFESKPSAAKIFINNTEVGKTPLTIEVAKGDRQTFSIEKEGYSAAKGELETSTSPWFYANALGGVMSTTSTMVDKSTDALYQFETNNYFADLKIKNERSSDAKRNVRKFIILNNELIRVDIAKGQGEWLDALKEMLNDRVSTEELKALAIQFTDTVAFAQVVAEL